MTLAVGDTDSREYVLEWRLPESGQRVVMISSGMGDGIFSGYWGIDADEEIACLSCMPVRIQAKRDISS